MGEGAVYGCQVHKGVNLLILCVNLTGPHGTQIFG